MFIHRSASDCNDTDLKNCFDDDMPRRKQSIPVRLGVDSGVSPPPRQVDEYGGQNDVIVCSGDDDVRRGDAEHDRRSDCYDVTEEVDVEGRPTFFKVV